MCLICMKYRIIFLIIIIISLGQILLSYIANTSRTHERTHERTHASTLVRTHPRERVHTPPPPPTHTPPSPYRYSKGLCQPTVSARSAGDNSWSMAIEIKTGTGGRFPRGVECFSHIKKLLSRTETRTRERMYWQTIRTVRDISRDDRARIATCRLRTPTYRQT